MFANISTTQLLIVLVIFVVLFGGKRIRSLGTDIGMGLRSFRDGFRELEHTSDDINKEIRKEAAAKAEPWTKEGSK
jgi:sec-independent protein translocase protein TatA